MRCRTFWIGMFSCVALPLWADVQSAAKNPAPDRIRPQVVVLSGDWLAQIPTTGRVNFPPFYATVYPGQQIALGLLAEGPNRDSAFDGVTVTARFAETGSEEILRPVAVRQIKAQGADFALGALKAAGLGEDELAKAEESTSLVTLAVFAPKWRVPLEPGTEVGIDMAISGIPSTVAVDRARLAIKRTSEWLAEAPLSLEEVQEQMKRSSRNVAPGEVLSWFRVLARSQHFDVPAVEALFVFALKSSAANRDAAVEAYPALEPQVQAALLRTLRRAGYDLRALFPALPAETIADFKSVHALTDPRDMSRILDSEDRRAVAQIGHAMDQCWAAWQATGDKTYLRALVDLLLGAPHFPAFKKWQEDRGGLKGLSVPVARGMAYQIAGWSIGSFQRTDPLVADWLSYWQNDPAVPAVIRAEINTLPANPHFRRK